MRKGTLYHLGGKGRTYRVGRIFVYLAGVLNDPRREGSSVNKGKEKKTLTKNKKKGRRKEKRNGWT